MVLSSCNITATHYGASILQHYSNTLWCFHLATLQQHIMVLSSCNITASHYGASILQHYSNTYGAFILQHCSNTLWCFHLAALFVPLHLRLHLLELTVSCMAPVIKEIITISGFRAIQSIAVIRLSVSGFTAELLICSIVSCADFTFEIPYR